MTLKEAFRYQNFLARLADKLAEAMMNPDNIMTTTKVHHLNAANNDAQDKTETVKVNNPVNINLCLKLYERIIEEVETLTAAIERTKASLNICMDAAIRANTQRQRMANIIRGVLKNKESEAQTTGTSYKFNNEGNQAAYVYEITIKKSENFNRKDFKAAMDKALQMADVTSGTIDGFTVNSTVDYTAPWDVNATLDDVLEALAGEAA